jgi:hypothetical protein
MAKKTAKKRKPKYGSWISKKKMEELSKKIRRRKRLSKSKVRFEYTLRADSPSMRLTVIDH